MASTADGGQTDSILNTRSSHEKSYIRDYNDLICSLTRLL